MVQLAVGPRDLCLQRVLLPGSIGRSSYLGGGGGGGVEGLGLGREWRVVMVVGVS